MATHRTFGKLATRLFLFAGRVQDNSLKTVKRAALAADQSAVLLTPVDTGRARANWVVAIGQARPGSRRKGYTGGTKESRGAQAAERALSQGRETIGRYQLGSGGIFISNNLPYILKLEQGSSTQRPEGMLNGALEAARRQFRKARIL